MRIDSSTVVMESQRDYQSVKAGNITIGTGNKNNTTGKKDVNGSGINLEKKDQVELSKDAKAQAEKMKRDFIESQERARQQNSNGLAQSQSTGLPLYFNSLEDDPELSLIEMMIQALGLGKSGDSGKYVGTMSYSRQSVKFFSKSISVSTASGGDAARTPGVVKTEVTASMFQSESENTTFKTAGIAKTADGREINFNIDLEMSRSFTEYAEMKFEQKIKYVDPLVINLGPGVTFVSDKKIFFDLDGDGTKENISQLGSGNGFLALDKNNDGVINDGTELFGAKTGDGFKELTAYDEDGNGWIDENDSVFKKLKIWTKDENDKDVLMCIGKAGIGAIFLGSASTEFSLNSNETNAHNGQIRRTGVYLTETGEAKTIQHLDLAV